MSEELKPCPFCESKKIEHLTVFELGHAVVECLDCHVRLERSRDVEAIAAWNRRAQPENPPLILEQLRKMDGETVWLTFPNSERQPCGAIISKDERSERWFVYSSSRGTWAYIWVCDYGKTWLAYRYKKESDSNENQS
jgi:hypothetical protein